jgi:hypothetical protein
VKISKAERTRVLRAVDYGWYMDPEGFREFVRSYPGHLYQLAWDCLTILEDEPWRSFGDVLNTAWRLSLTQEDKRSWKP